ncbi:Uncharacterized protein SCF082_LOCUS6556 [Durusdinium trenchii]|uniref:Uncharacterized protein n=1 Tax=Durusdinium trenchii TaxID=1381693 RepID=A0ABP0IDA9_9DINO
MDDLGFESFNARIHVCRSSYALIGQKYPTDGPPLAEVHTAAGEGKAIAVARLKAGLMRRGRFGGAHLLDAVIEDGVIIHYETESFHADQVLDVLNNSGQVMAGYVTGTALDLIEAQDAWAMSEAREDPTSDLTTVSILVQVVAWYVVCNGIKFNGCHRPNLIDLPEDEGLLLVPCQHLQVDVQEFEVVLLDMFLRFNALVTQAMDAKKTDSFRYLDIFALGASMPDETLDGHGSQILQLWTWQALLGGFCSSSSAATGSQVRFDGPLCWRKTALW